MGIVVTSTSSQTPTPAEQAPSTLAKGTVGEEADKSATAPKADPKAPAESDTATEEDEGKQDETDESDEAEESAKPEDDAKPKKKGGFQKRIEKLNSRVTAAQEERDYWKAQALKAAKPEEAAAQIDPPKAEDEAGKPDPDKFETYSEYVEALADWKLDKREAKAKAEADKARRESEQKSQETAHYERVQAFIKEHADYPEVLEGVRELAISPTVENLLITSENGPELLYELAKNPEEFKRVNALSPLAAARELGRLESKLQPKSSEAPKPEPKKTTKAPEPIAPVGSKGGTAEKSIYDPSLSQAEYERLRRKQREASG